MKDELYSKKQKHYFESAYQTGSDTWTHLPLHLTALSLLPPLSQDSLVLDLGSGRGLWAVKLLESGYRVLAVDYISSVVDLLNRKIAQRGYLNRGKSIVGNILTTPFSKKSFSLVTDIGALQHLSFETRSEYVDEVHRVLKKDGYYLNVSFSRNTNRFYEFRPSKSETGEFYKFNVLHYFFTRGEIKKSFESHFEILNQKEESFDSPVDPGNNIVLIFTLMKKKTANL